MRRHLSYANVVATMALVLAISGSALAANHYLLSSTRQISPALLKKLKGTSGKPGPSGPAGPVGPKGGEGPKGVEGLEGRAAPTVLASGKTEVGDYGAWGRVEWYLGANITFPTPLASGLDENHVHFVAKNASGAPECPGSAVAPSAAPGNLCVYEAFNKEAAWEGIFRGSDLGDGTDAYGFDLYFHAEGSTGGGLDYGTWAVTAP